MSEGGPTRLEGNEAGDFARENLIQIVVDDVDWKILHRDASTGDYWKEYFPHSELHGGGPPVFEKISRADAELEFKVDLSSVS